MVPEMRGPLLCLIALLACGQASAESFASWSSKAQKGVKRKDPAAALQAYSNALRLWKKSDGKKAKAQALIARAALYEEKRDFDSEIQDLARALEIDKKNPTLLHRRGRAYLENEDTSRAIDDFIKAIAVKLDFKEAYADRALAYERQGEFKFAAEDRRTACKLGLKSACPKIKRSPSKRARRAAKNKNAQPVNQPEAPAPAKIDFDACIADLKRCVGEGQTYDKCVADAPICDEDAESPCCPPDCIKEYRRAISEGSSEASTFRLVFSAGRRCNPIPPKSPAEDPEK